MPTPEELDGLDAQEETQGKIEDLPDWAQKHIRELRNQAKERRLALKKAEEEAREREDARLAEAGNWKQLAEEAKKELARVKPYEDRATALDAIIRASNDALIAQLPEHLRKAVPLDYPPEKLHSWLEATVPILIKPNAPDLNQGAGGTGGGTKQTPQLTDDEKRIAKAFGLSEEDYAKNKE